MHVAKLHIQGNSLVGLYIVAMDEIVLVGPEVPDKYDKDLAEIFKAKVVRTTIAGTSLIGIFAATNGKELLVPHMILDNEEEILKENNISYHKIQSNLTCHGNNIVANKNAAILNPNYEEEAAEQIKTALGTDIFPASVDDAPTVGSFMVANDKYGLVSHEVSDVEFDHIVKVLKIELDAGTVNMGSTTIGSGIVVNTEGFVIGDMSGGPEVMNADEVLGFLNRGDEQ